MLDVSSISNINSSNVLSGLSFDTDKSTKTNSFESLYQSMINMIEDTNNLTNKAEEEEIKYAAGEDNTLELMLAQNKANMSLSYAVQIRNKVIDAYKEIMNLQF